MQFKFKSLVAATLLGAVSLASHAVVPEKDLPVVIKNLKKTDNIVVEKKFPAASGLTGYILKFENDYSLAYVTADGKSMLIGALIDENIENLSAVYAEKHIPAPDYEAAFAQLEDSLYLTSGAKGKDVKAVAYVFYDVNCGYCHQVHGAYEKFASAGLQVKYMPVAFLQASSLTKAVKIHSSKDPAKALAYAMNNRGQIDPETSAVEPKALEDQIAKNGELMANFGARGTPATIYKDSKGAVQIQSGAVGEAVISQMFGLTVKK